MNLVAKYLSPVIFSFISILLVACNSGDSAQDSNTILYGKFVDSPVQGLKYSTNTLSGITDSLGRYQYKKGETVTFFLGKNLLGSALGRPQLTPIDIVLDAEDETDATVTNIIRFLQSIDADNNPENGIVISNNIQAKLEIITLDFSSPVFSITPALLDFFRTSDTNGGFSEQRTLTSTTLAREHLRWSLFGEVPPPLPPLNKKVEIIENSPFIDPLYQTSPLDFDVQGEPHIIVGGDHLYHIYRTKTGWKSETIDSQSDSPGFYSVFNVRVDRHNFIFVFLIKDGETYFATNRSGNWSIEKHGHLNGQVNFDKFGYIHNFGYDFATGNFFHATNGSDKWESVFLGGSGSDGPPSSPYWMTGNIDSKGNIHIAFIKTTGYSIDIEHTTLMYASNSSGSWKVELLHESFSTLPDILVMDVDNAGIPHIGYFYNEVIHGSKYCMPSPCDNYDEVRYFTKTEGEWLNEMVVGWDSVTDISLSKGRNGSLDFFISTGSQLYTANKSGNTWDTTLIANDLNTSGHFSFEYKPTGEQAISYISNNGVKFITKTGNKWETQTAFNQTMAGRFHDSVLDNYDNLHVAYWDMNAGAIKYATNALGSWNSEVLINKIKIDARTSIAADSNGYAHVAFVDSSTNTLNYATNNSGSWFTETIGGPTNVSRAPSLILDADGNPHIVYYNWRLSSWMYAGKPDGEWVTEKAIDGFSDDFMDMGVSSAGVIYICYGIHWGDNKGAYLTHKTVGNTQWITKQIDTNAIEKSNCSIAVDTLGNIHLAYKRINLDFVYGDQLVYSNNKSGSWIYEIVATGTHTGEKINMTLDAQSNPVMTYYISSDAKVNYAYKAANKWFIGELASTNTFRNPKFRAPVAMDSLGRIQASYFDSSDNDLKTVIITTP